MAPVSFTAVGIVAIVGLVALSAFFSSSESAIFTLPEDWAAEGEDGRAAALHDLEDDPHRLLVTILVGNNVVNMAIASITTALVSGVLPAGRAVTASTVVASFVVLVFGEIVPKSYGLANAREWALTIARPLAAVGWVLYPLVVVFDVLTGQINNLIGGETGIEKPYLDDQ
jgi:CBS domain containing-hemolysin-like protein